MQRCLAKDPDERWESARDLMLELQWLTQTQMEKRGDAGQAPATPPDLPAAAQGAAPTPWRRLLGHSGDPAAPPPAAAVRRCRKHSRQ